MINLKFYLGREFFVGLSQYTNEAGARAVAAAFPEYPCVPVKVKKLLIKLIIILLLVYYI